MRWRGGASGRRGGLGQTGPRNCLRRAGAAPGRNEDMAFRLKRAERVGKGVKRIVRRQVGEALQGLQKTPSEDETVHEARKHFKKVRAVLRLVRDEVGDKVYRRENARFRDAG